MSSKADIRRLPYIFDQCFAKYFLITKWFNLLFFSFVFILGRTCVAQENVPIMVDFRKEVLTSNVRFLTSDPDAVDLWPCFSPDGNSILFSRSVDGEKTWEFHVVSKTGGDVNKLTDRPLPVSTTRASWSNRINQIAFTGTTADDNNNVWVINPDGTNARQIVSAGLSNQVFYPSWYPDGKQLVIMDASDRSIKRIDLKSDGATVVTVTDLKQVLTGMPSVSPDGK